MAWAADGGKRRHGVNAFWSTWERAEEVVTGKKKY